MMTPHLTPYAELGASQWLRLALIFRGYEAAEMPALNQIFYLLPELYAIVRSAPLVPMELIIPRVISFGRI